MISPHRRLFLLFSLVLILSMPVWGQRTTSGGPAPQPQGAGSILDDAPAAVQSLDFGRNKLTFNSKTQLALVPVVVRGKDGRHIPRLGKEAFQVFENGKERPIENVDEIQGTVLPAQKVTPEGGLSNQINFQNATGTSSRAPLLMIVAIDLINTPGLLQTQAKRAMIDFLARSIPQGAMIQLVVMRPDGVKLVHDFTSDPRLLQAALAKFQSVLSRTNTADAREDTLTLDNNFDYSGLIGIPEQATFQRMVNSLINREDFHHQQQATISTMDALQNIAQNFNGIPGRKSLVWITSGLPFTLTSPTSFMGTDGVSGVALESDSGRRGTGDYYIGALHALSAANISVYPVDIRGLQGIGISGADPRSTQLERSTNPRFSASQAQLRDTAQESIETMKTVADMTGGRAFYNSNDITGSIGKAMEDGESYYILSYRLNTDDTKPGWRKLQVKVQADGARVRARQGFFLTQPSLDPLQGRRTDLYLAFHSHLNYTGMPFQVNWQAKPIGNGKTKYTVEMMLPPNVPDLSVSEGQIDLDFGISVKDEKGAEKAGRLKSYKNKLAAADVAQVRQDGITIRDSFEVTAGDYNVTFVTRDNLNGRLGSIVSPLKVIDALASK